MAVSLTQQITDRRLIVAGNDELWYEDIEVSAGDMTELTAANGGIDTSDQLTMAAAFQKVFIANGANLKIADFINTKIATSDIGANAPDSGTVLTGDTSSASMIVDYITADTDDAASTIYGYRTTDETFENAETVTGTDDDGNSVSFTTSAAETSSPHWYDWTVFAGNATTYGAMPNRAYLVCVYRGRIVLAGNPEYPNQWYMTRVARPFDFLYGADDPMSAVAGNNADAGQCPDIIRSLISFHDDYLIFGCASTLWILRGDPVAGGSLDNLSDTTGMFGSHSWCFDDDRNLYFWGTGGIYKVEANFSGISNLTETLLPDLINDEGADPETHRITIAYDKKRHGLVICITVLATGVNSNYFYSFKTRGFFPESYPEECGPYSLLYYDANDPDYADLLIGCRDGYIRKFVNTAKDDDIGDTDEAISSYVTYPITPLSEPDTNGKLVELVFDLGGGASNGAFSDTDGVSYSLFNGDDAETVLEDVIDGATAFTSGTLSGTGRKNKLRPRMRGAYMGLKLSNSTASETWAINKVLFNTRKAGRV